MNPLLATVPVIVALIGIAVIIVALVAPAPEPDPAAPRRAPLKVRIRAAFTGGDGRRRARLLIGLVAGVILWAISGWFVALVAVPVGVVYLPDLMAKPSTRGIDLTEALAAWTRNMSGLIRTGSLNLEDVIRMSLPSTAPIIRTNVGRLVGRFQGGTPTVDALRAFADELSDPASDKVVMHLIQAAKKRSGDVAAPLAVLADEMAADVKVRRSVEADRAKPRQSLRIVTLITVGVIALLPLFGRTSQLAPYSTPLGQVALIIWIGLYVLLLVWIQRTVREKPMPRLLVATDEPKRANKKSRSAESAEVEVLR